MIDTNIYITYVTCVTYVTYGYVHMLQLIIIKTVGFIFSHLLAVKIFCLQPTLKNPHFHEMHQRVFCLQMFCFVCGIIAHKLSQSDFDRPFSQDQLKTYREWMPLSSRLSKMYFSLLFVFKLFWLDFYSFWSQSILTRAFHIETVLQCTLSKLWKL